MAYLATADITDQSIGEFADQTTYWSAILAEADNALNDLSEALGLDSAYIATPLHTYVKQWLVAWFCERVALDHINTNNLEASDDKYLVKWRLYSGIRKDREGRITIAMLQKNVSNQSQRIQSGHLWVS
jgi:hypothetical protein